MPRIAIVIALLAALGVAASAEVRAQAGAGAATTATVEVTVWRSIADPALLYVSTRPAGGRWRTLNTALDMSMRSASGRFHQSNAVRVDVPLGRGATAAVEVTVWRAVADPTRLYVSTRPEGGRWNTGNTPLDLSQRSASGRFHQSNAVRIAVAVGPPPVPDLVVDPPTVDVSRPMAGQAFALTVTVRNRGTGPAEDATVIYYRSDDATVTPGDAELGRDWVAGLAAATGRSAESLRTQAPGAPGTYYYGACVAAVAGEAERANNCSPAVAVSVAAFDYEQLPWVADGLTGEEPAALERIRDLARVDVAMSQRVAGAAWLADGVTADEVITLNGLVFGTFAESHPAIVIQLTTVPDRTGHLFKNALRSVGTMFHSDPDVYGPGRLEQLQQQAWFRDGLTEEEAALIVGLHWITGDERILEDLLRDGQVRSETTTLSLAGVVDLYAIGRSRLDLAGQLERMRAAAAAMETFLGTPWPQPATVAIVEVESEYGSPNYDGWNEGAKQHALCPHTLGRQVVAAALRDLFESGRGTERITTADAIYQAFLRHAPPAERDTFRRWYACLRGESSSEGIPPAELRQAAANREALAAFYHATNGPGWTTSTNWLSAAPLDQWHGVSVGGDGAVVELDLADNQISGPIPAATLGRLTQLRALRLAGNQLSGPIPPELGGLARLEWLSLGDNQLSGPIPPELGNLARLQDLALHRNQLSGPIPPALGNLARLVGLHLSQNQLSGPIPPELGRGAWLMVLDLGHNRLSGPIPPALGNLGLVALHLSQNQLSGPIPPELGNLAQLTALHLDSNRLSGPIPPALGRLTQLQQLGLGINQLSGPIPPALGGLAQLEWLNLGQNRLSGPIPSALGGLAQLTALYLWDNQLSGPIPPALGGLAQLTALGLGANALTGCVPPSLWALPEHDLDFLGLPTCDDA